uniref:Uncharacterized protein n=1 Tax=Cacopsylla melanoneura TaxID=428564 RepID=A0A8D9E4F6_9HEMI
MGSLLLYGAGVYSSVSLYWQFTIVWGRRVLINQSILAVYSCTAHACTHQSDYIGSLLLYGACVYSSISLYWQFTPVQLMRVLINPTILAVYSCTGQACTRQSIGLYLCTRVCNHPWPTGNHHD